MRIAISGKAGTGKSTVARFLAEKLRINHYSIGDLMRAMALEKGMNLLELNRVAENDKSIDFELDDKLKELGREKDGFVVDGRLAAFFIPHSDFRIFLEADDRIRAERVLKDKREQEKSQSIEEAIINIKRREESEKKRYKRLYGIDYTDKNLYNLVIDTTNLTPIQVVEKIIRHVEAKQKSL